MPLSRSHTHMALSDDALPKIGKAALATVRSVLSAVDQHVDVPLRIFATQPTANAVLNFGTSRVTNGDGSKKTIGPGGGALPFHAGSTINAQTGNTVTGDTVLTNGGAFAWPTASGSGKFFRMAIVFNRVTNSYDTAFSAEQATEGALPDPSSLFSSLTGAPCAYVDLESTSTSAYKTAASATSIIENAKIFRIDPAAPIPGSGTPPLASAWYDDDSVTSFAHGTSMAGVLFYTVQEWDVIAGTTRNLLDPNALVTSFDADDVFLDWSALSPSANLQYRVVVFRA